MKGNTMEMLQNLPSEQGEGSRQASLLSSDAKNSGYDTKQGTINFLAKLDALQLFTTSLKAQM